MFKKGLKGDKYSLFHNVWDLCWEDQRMPMSLKSMQVGKSTFKDKVYLQFDIWAEAVDLSVYTWLLYMVQIPPSMLSGFSKDMPQKRPMRVNDRSDLVKGWWIFLN